MQRKPLQRSTQWDHTRCSCTKDFYSFLNLIIIFSDESRTNTEITITICLPTSFAPSMLCRRSKVKQIQSNQDPTVQKSLPLHGSHLLCMDQQFTSWFISYLIKSFESCLPYQEVSFVTSISKTEAFSYNTHSPSQSLGLLSKADSI